MKNKKLVILVGLLILAGCASRKVVPGEVLMRTSSNSAHVAFTDKDVKVGDKVDLLHEECVSDGGNEKGVGAPDNCKVKTVGHGIVTELFGSDYVQVRFTKGTRFAIGDKVKKQTK